MLVSCDGYNINNFTAHTTNALHNSQHYVQQEKKQFFKSLHKSPHPKPSFQEVRGHHVTHQCQGHNKHSSTQSHASSVYRSLGVVIRSSNIGTVGKIVFDDNPESSVSIYTKNKGAHLVQTRLYWISKCVAPGNHTISIHALNDGKLQVAGFVMAHGDFSGYPYYRPFDVARKVWKLQ